MRVHIRSRTRKETTALVAAGLILVEAAIGNQSGAMAHLHNETYRLIIASQMQLKQNYTPIRTGGEINTERVIHQCKNQEKKKIIGWNTRWLGGTLGL